jgi:hypothetical protein
MLWRITHRGWTTIDKNATGGRGEKETEDETYNNRGLGTSGTDTLRSTTSLHRDLISSRSAHRRHLLVSTMKSSISSPTSWLVCSLWLLLVCLPVRSFYSLETLAHTRTQIHGRELPRRRGRRVVPPGTPTRKARWKPEPH